MLTQRWPLLSAIYLRIIGSQSLNGRPLGLAKRLDPCRFRKKNENDNSSMKDDNRRAGVEAKEC